MAEIGRETISTTAAPTTTREAFSNFAVVSEILDAIAESRASPTMLEGLLMICG